MTWNGTVYTNAALASASMQSLAATSGIAPVAGLNADGYYAVLLANMLTDLPPGIKTAQIAAAKFTLNVTAGGTTAAVGDLTGAAIVNATYSLVGAANLTTRTAVQMVADAGLTTASAYLLIVTNTSGGTTTVVGGVGVTITGTATLVTNTTRTFVVTVQSATAMTLQSIASSPV
jgi:hypothetical protein